MPKKLVTRKWLAEHFTCASVGMGELGTLLSCREPDYYTTGAHGWNFDAYVFGDKALTVGVRDMIPKVSYPYYKNRDFECMACSAMASGNLSISEVVMVLKSLLDDYVAFVFEGKKEQDRLKVGDLVCVKLPDETTTSFTFSTTVLDNYRYGDSANPRARDTCALFSIGAKPKAAFDGIYEVEFVQTCKFTNLSSETEENVTELDFAVISNGKATYIVKEDGLVKIHKAG